MFFRRSSKKQEVLSDAELLLRYQSEGDKALVALLFERYADKIYAICLKYLKDEPFAKDAAMEVFERLLTALKKHEVQNFPSWLAQLVRNHCLTRLRKQKSQQQKIIAFQHFQEGNMEWEPFLHLEEKRTHEATLQALTTAVAQLKPEQKICIELFYLKQKSYKEVAEISGFSLKQVKSHIQNGKRKLRLLLNNEHAG